MDLQINACTFSFCFLYIPWKTLPHLMTVYVQMIIEWIGLKVILTESEGVQLSENIRYESGECSFLRIQLDYISKTAKLSNKIIL